ncbi:MAG: tetratricopeptide repeat-containing sulfotransferase family protein [Rudaea sp.]
MIENSAESLPAGVVPALQNGRPHEAEKLLRTFLKKHPDHVDAMTLLGLSLLNQDHAAEAAQCYEKLTRLEPRGYGHWNNLGTAARAAGQTLVAEKAYRQAIALYPGYFDALMNLGYLFLERGLYPPAREQFLKAHAIDPDAPDARIYAAQMCFALDSRDLAERLLEPWHGWTQLSDELALELAILMTHFGKADDGTRIFQRLLRDNPDNPRALAHLAIMYERVNRLDEARAMLARLPQPDAAQNPALTQEIVNAHATLALRERDPAQARGLLEAMIREQRATIERAGPEATNPWRYDNLYFALAKACDRQNDVDAAMTALAQAHSIQIELARQSLPELLEPGAQPLRTATKWVSIEARASWPDYPAPGAAESPIFIVGFPRSGTTMLEQMLDAHPTLQAMDERAFLQDLVERMSDFGFAYPYDLGKLSAAQCEDLRRIYWRLTAQVAPRKEGQRLVDKNPLNMLRLPLINRLFPHAPIILALRHPCDVILSNYMQHFRSNAFAVLCSSLERLARGYVTAMEFWLHHASLLKPVLLQSRYEDLIDDFPGNVKRIGDFLCLDDAQPLARFDQHARDKGFISTPSYTQVIEPPNKNAVDRWRRYHKYFEPVLPVLAPLVRHWGYTV